MSQSTVNPNRQPPQQTVTPPTEHTRATAVKTKPQRVLACVLCQQRKVKCDRTFPCANCTRVGVQCVPANTLGPRQRRRRFPERELLERLRHYEDLLRRHSIDFEPLHPSAPGSGPTVGHTSPTASLHDTHSDAEVLKDKAAERANDPVIDIWHAINRVTLDDEDEDNDSDADNNHRRPHHDAVLKTAWSYRFQAEGNDQVDDHLLADLSSSHPEQVQIFRLWQIYLDNVNPLLRVTHTPTLQARIIDAASDVTNITPALEALIFSIYSVSIVSITDDECRNLFQVPRKQLLARYQSACQQALLKCHAWRSGDHDGMVAVYLYLVSVRHKTDPRSLSCMLAMAIRIAQRMGMHSDSTNAGYTPLEAEMRRRLWWSLVIFDHRICELSDYKTTTLDPTWDCSTPLNVNDFEIRADMKHSPANHEKPTEALFAVVRSELADFIRHSTFHLNFVNPSLKAIARPKTARHGPLPEGGELMVLEKTIEDKYLAFCDAEDPIHYMTIWTARGCLARNRLLEYYSRHSRSSVLPTDTQRRAALSYAMSMLECDTKLRTSSLTRKYLWLVNFHFPALAYLHILIHVRRRPADDDAENAWGAISDNYDAVVTLPNQHSGEEQVGIGSFFVAFSRVILQAWEAREVLLREGQKPPEPPLRIVSDVRNRMMQMGWAFPPDQSTVEQSDAGSADISSNANSSSMPIAPMDSGDRNSTGGAQNFAGQAPAGPYPGIPGQPIMDADMGQYWTDIDWRWLNTYGW